MTTTRLEAFSDGVIAILITIMVLELKVPEGATVEALRPLAPLFLAYVLSFVVVGIYWTNHHHLLHATARVNGAILWANLHLLFWLSLIPVVTWWMGQNSRAAVPAAAYGMLMFACAIAWTVLQGRILLEPANREVLAAAIGEDMKGRLSLLLYAVAIPAAFVHPWISDALYAGVALMWLVPDRRIESRLPH
jgi:TMEM175 potassium channel family protein